LITKKFDLKPFYVILIGLLIIALIHIASNTAGIVINTTSSMPDIFYRIGDGKGSPISFCSPVPHKSVIYGACPDGSMPLVKRKVGVAGDVVYVTDDGVSVNGMHLPNSRPLDLDSKGKDLPHLRGEFTLQNGEVWTAGEHPQSFDSRYFGPVRISKN